MAATDAPVPFLVDGAWRAGGEPIEVRSPFDGALVGRVGSATAQDARDAIDAAERAMLTPLARWQRGDILERVSGLIAANADLLAESIAREAGKPIRLARVEVDRARTTLALSAGEARRLHGEQVPIDGYQPGDGRTAFTVRVPAGIVGAITPFNFPLNLVCHKVAPAIAAGCAVVLKPADRTPLTALHLARLFEEAGLPAGWLNVVVGPPEEIVGALTEDDRVRVLTFTGSARIGWMLRSNAPRKKVMLELGNASPLIVHRDADLELAATKIAAHAFTFAGQTCVSVQRVLVDDAIHDELLELLIPKVEALKVGDPLDEAFDVGPVIDGVARDRIRSWIDEAVAEGARVATGGGEGEHLRPTVLVDATPSMRVCTSEIFGPVCSLVRVRDFDEAIAIANGTEYGLQASVFTSSIKAAMRAVAELDFGSVLINEAPEYRVDQMPYGGTKASGNTKEGPAYAVQELTEERLVVLGG
jgi:acyl-CoA reductase-like NAD-dependent aldehyde dehydrogenase